MSENEDTQEKTAEKKETPKKSTNDAAELIAAYKEAAAKPIRARMIMAFVLIGVILLNLAMMYSAIKGFVKDGLPELAANLQTEMAPIVARHMPGASAALTEVSDAYTAAFAEVYEREAPEIAHQMRLEGAALERNLQNRWPEFEKAIAQLALSQEIVINDEVEKVIGTRKFTDLSVRYQDVLVEKFEETLSRTMARHVDISEQIGSKFADLARREPDIKPPVNPHQTLGILLELLGIELQARAEEARAKTL